MPKQARAVTTFVCSECGGESLRWAGQCPHCRAWNTLQEFTVRAEKRPRGLAATAASVGAPAAPVPLPEVDTGDWHRLRLRWDELNRVLGGGIVPGSLVLVGGEPGVGKSTLLIQLAGQAGEGGRQVLYVSGEESAQQVRLRAERVGVNAAEVLLLAENDLDRILDALVAAPPALAIVDSIQTVYDGALEAAAGSVSQVRESAARLMRLAKETGIPIFLVGHVTKEGAIAGPRVLEHIVDTVLYLEGDRQHEFRILRATKNRFGSTDEIGIFTMGGEGLLEVADPGGALLSTESLARAGTAVVPALEGTRPFLVEVQTLVGDERQNVPGRRSVNGFDLNRLHMLLAVCERAGVRTAYRDVYVNLAGGFRLQEPAGDLAVALALAGSLHNRALGADVVAVGEVGLTGELRRVSQLDRRLQEAARRGFRRAIVPAGAASAAPPGLEISAARDLREALQLGFELAVLN
jgi:DNA repair protein RadA/Sms